MNLRRYAVLRIVCVFLLLLAQQSALTHDVWHSAKLASQADVSVAGDAKDVKKNRLCDFHAALGSVLGVLSGNAPASLLADLPDAQVDAAAVPAAVARLLPPTSRGPPTLL